MSVDLDAIHAGLPAVTDTVRLVVSDMDGTILTPHKELAPSTLQAVKALQEAGITLCLASARPPASMLPYVRKLGLASQNAGFNGGIIFAPDGTFSVNRVLPRDAVKIMCDMLHVHKVETWLLTGEEWLVKDAATPFVGHERRHTGLVPRQVDNLYDHFEGVGKVMGISTDYDLVERMETEIGVMLKGEASVRRSNESMLDITPVLANKGEALRALSDLYGVRPEETACIGDAPNDLSMFAVSGLSIAMGQATDDIKANAQFVTDTNERNGWASAVSRFILPRAPKK